MYWSSDKGLSKVMYRPPVILELSLAARRLTIVWGL